MAKSYIRGAYAQAACSLVDHLKSKGVSASVGYPSQKRNRTLYAYVREGAVEQVPKNWDGFTVIASVEEVEDGR